MRHKSTATSSWGRVALSFALLSLLACLPVFALVVPDPQGFVTDLAGIYAPQERAALEDLLFALNANTTAEIAVLTIPSLEGDSLEEFATRTFREWGVGSASTDNGVLLVLVMDERAVRIEVGYGLEGAITDLDSGRIIRDLIVPAFQQGDYAGGTRAAVETLAAYAAQDPVARAAAVAPQARTLGWSAALIALYVLLLILTVGTWRRAVLKALGIRVSGYVAALLVASVIGTMAFRIVGVVCLFAFLFFLSFGSTRPSGGGGHHGGFGGLGGGGITGRGGGGLGGLGGGGFGGFGGGSSGGGGASGRW